MRAVGMRMGRAGVCVGGLGWGSREDRIHVYLDMYLVYSILRKVFVLHTTQAAAQGSRSGGGVCIAGGFL